LTTNTSAATVAADQQTSVHRLRHGACESGPSERKRDSMTTRPMPSAASVRAERIARRQDLPRVRPFALPDARDVASLFVATFRPGGRASAEAVERYAKHVYFENPWRHAGLPCLVHEGRAGRIEGFLGVMPRRMRWRGEPLVAAVAGNLMVRADADGRRDPLVAVNLVRTFLAGPQDVSWTDTATDASRRIWEACGGFTLRAHSLLWVRPIRPMRFGVSEVARRGGSRVMCALGRLVAPALDAIPTRVALRPARRAAAGTTIDDLRPADLDRALRENGRHAIGPCESVATLGWLLEAVGAKRGLGAPRRALVRGAKGEAIGWFVYFRKRGRIAEVVDLGARPEHASAVVGRLIVDAAEGGAIALRGRADVDLVTPLSRAWACFYNAGAWVLAHSRRPELREALRAEDASLRGLEGETWMRWYLDPFE
jgi:hypothetical protein